LASILSAKKSHHHKEKRGGWCSESSRGTVCWHLVCRWVASSPNSTSYPI